MPRSGKQKNINLIPLDEFESSTTGRILKWALSSFRIMVIATELIVMSAFLSRFWLDAKNSDLNEELEISKAQIEAYADIETNFRLIQKKLKIAKAMYMEPRISNYMDTFSKILPQDISLNSISITDNQLQLRASALSENSIAQFLINMEKTGNFNNLNLTQISTSTDNNNMTVFTINGGVGSTNTQVKN